MRLEFTGRHIEVTPALKEHARSHFEKIEDLFAGKNPKVHVIIEVERGRHRAEAVVNWRNDTLTATATNSDMYRSLSLVVGKIEKQARRLKEKVIDRAHKAKKTALVAARRSAGKQSTARKVSAPAPAPAPAAANGPRIVRTKRYNVKQLTPDEAAKQLAKDRSGFVLFRDRNSDNLSLMFKRTDGDLGLIET